MTYVLNSFCGSLTPLSIRLDVNTAEEARKAIRKTFPNAKVRFSRDLVYVTNQRRERLCLYYQEANWFNTSIVKGDSHESYE